jgi:rod shape-determining protein MreC
VVQYDPSNWWQAAIIDRGWADNPDLASDQPVITPRGVVGKVGVVGKYSSRIVFLTDDNCRISVEVEETRARGILSGAGLSLTGKPQAKISFVSRDTPLPIGARVFSSGLGGVFPQGLLVGTVREAPPLSADLNFGLYREGKIEPIVDLDNLKEVFIIVGAP